MLTDKLIINLKYKKILKQRRGNMLEIVKTEGKSLNDYIDIIGKEEIESIRKLALSLKGKKEKSSSYKCYLIWRRGSRDFICLGSFNERCRNRG